MGKKRRQSDAVVCRSRLFAKSDNPKLPLSIEFDQLFAEAQPNHSVADDDDRLSLRTTIVTCIHGVQLALVAPASSLRRRDRMLSISTRPLLSSVNAQPPWLDQTVANGRSMNTMSAGRPIRSSGLA